MPAADRNCVAAGCAALLLCVSPGADADSVDAAIPPPEGVIADVARNLAAEVEIHQAELRDKHQVEALVERLLLPHFDFETSCRLILHEYWRSATADQRRRFVDAFYHYLLASHGDALQKFRAETIQVLPSPAAAAGKSARVRTRMKLADGDVFMVDFYLRLDEGGWRVVDVIAEGISYVRTYRSDFGLEVRANGLEALTDRLEAAAARKR